MTAMLFLAVTEEWDAKMYRGRRARSELIKFSNMTIPNLFGPREGEHAHACVCCVHVVYKNQRMSGKPCLFKACCSRGRQVLRQLFCLFALSNPPRLCSTGLSGLIIHKPGHHLHSCLNKSFPLINAATKCPTGKPLMTER